MFYSRLIEHAGGVESHLSSETVAKCKTYCESCVAKEVQKMKEDDIVGVLTFKDAVEYTRIFSPSGASSVIRCNGNCVMDLTETEDKAVSLLFLILCNNLSIK